MCVWKWSSTIYKWFINHAKRTWSIHITKWKTKCKWQLFFQERTIRHLISNTLMISIYLEFWKISTYNARNKSPHNSNSSNYKVLFSSLCQIQNLTDHIMTKQTASAEQNEHKLKLISNGLNRNLMSHKKGARRITLFCQDGVIYKSTEDHKCSIVFQVSLFFDFWSLHRCLLIYWRFDQYWLRGTMML